MSFISDITDEYTDDQNHRQHKRNLREGIEQQQQDYQRREEARENDSIEAIMAALYYNRPEMADWDVDAIRDWEDTRY